jgi:hypothetical protein
MTRNQTLGANVSEQQQLGAKLSIDHIGRDAFFLIASGRPDIPDAHGRDCPQCGFRAWANSRFCWHCRWDFERLALAKRRRNLLKFFVAMNLVQTISLLFLILH